MGRRKPGLQLSNRTHRHSVSGRLVPRSSDRAAVAYQTGHWDPCNHKSTHRIYRKYEVHQRPVCEVVTCRVLFRWGGCIRGRAREPRLLLDCAAEVRAFHDQLVPEPTRSIEESLGQHAQALLEARDVDALLPGCVAVADCHRFVVQGIEVDSDAERGADLVLAPVAPADMAAGLVVLDPKLALKQRLHIPGDPDQVFL